MDKTFETVGELIDYLEKLGKDRILTVDVDGNTFHPTDNDISLWDEDKDSPVVINTHAWFDLP